MSKKGALALLADYGGDTSDEDVPSCRVSVKRMHKDDEEDHENKRLERLPVPNFTINNPEEVRDDPSLHEGRTRSFAHERGNWATYVYIPYESNAGLRRLMSIIEDVSEHENLGLKCFENFHLSLTRTVILKHHWIESFISSVKGSLADFTKFIVMVNSIEVYTNEEKTRTFLGLQVQTGHDTLLKIVNCLDSCLSEFKLPKFYEDPSFHISIAWCLGDCSEKISTILPFLSKDLEDLMSEYSQENWYIYVEEIMCKSGNKFFRFHLK